MVDLTDPIRRLLVTPDENISALDCLEAGYMNLDPKALTVMLLKTLWSYIKKMLGIQGFLTYTPLRRDLNYREIMRGLGTRR